MTAEKVFVVGVVAYARSPAAVGTSCESHYRNLVSRALSPAFVAQLEPKVL
jgi:hypothetical protein